MNTIPNIPTQVLNDLSDAIAIVTQRYDLVYANSAFKKAFPDYFKKNREICIKDFEELNLQRPEHKESSTHKRILISSLGRSCETTAYLLNKKGDQSFFLVLIKLGNIERKSCDDSIQLELLTNQLPGEKEIYSENLSQHFKKLVGNDFTFRKALIISQRAAKSNLPVLINGESGTGKEVLVKGIHQASHRCNKPLIDVNCAAIPDTLIESELFGYDKGAFTGAKSGGRKGYFDEANGGTIFLDEIGDASLQTQSKLLRVLEDGCFRRVGGNRNIKVDVRIISATNRNLQDLIAVNTFRKDLFYRLNTFAIHLPPLRERLGDIPLLVDYFLNEFKHLNAKSIKVSSEAMSILQTYPWPGNVRELKGVIAYAVNMAQGSVISTSSLPNFLVTYQKVDNREIINNPLLPAQSETLNLTTVIQRVEKDLINEAIAKFTNKSEAIRALGISRRTFYLKIKQYGLV